MGRLVDPETTAMGLIEAAASAGKACPSNETIAHAVGGSSPATGARIVQTLERWGAIKVQRFGAGREVEIVRTGARTATVGGKPHFTLRGIVKSPPRPKPIGERPIVDAEQHHGFRGVPPVDQYVDRDPCDRCGVRADYGCRHRPPSGTKPPVFTPFEDGRRVPRPGNGFNFKTRTRI